MTESLKSLDVATINEAAKAARRILDVTYPDRDYIPLILALPVHRDLVRQAKAGNAQIDGMLRQSLIAIIETIAWPESA